MDAVYAASGNYGGSTSNIVAQVVNALGDHDQLTSSPNPSTYGSSVTFTATVSATTGTPTGTVELLQLHHLGLWHQDLARDRDPGSGGQATYATSTLHCGTDYVEAVYAASGNYGGSTSAVLSQVVNAERRRPRSPRRPTPPPTGHR